MTGTGIRAEYKVRGGFRESDYSPTPDQLFALLDNLGLDEPPFIVIESHENAGRFIQALSVGERAIDVEFREDAQAELSAFPALDVLAAHQVILGCLSSPGGWVETAGRITGGLSTRELLAFDYSESGLSVQVALLDHVKRAKQLGVVTGTLSTVRWGALSVTGGDTWEVSGPGSVSVVFARSVSGQPHGISISSARPGLGFGDEPGVPEVVLWPDEAETEFTVDFDDTVDALRITNVFAFGEGDLAARVGRWAENSALWVETVNAQERVYHCNFYATSPATFDDLICRVRLTE